MTSIFFFFEFISMVVARHLIFNANQAWNEDAEKQPIRNTLHMIRPASAAKQKGNEWAVMGEAPAPAPGPAPRQDVPFSPSSSCISYGFRQFWNSPFPDVDITSQPIHHRHLLKTHTIIHQELLSS